MPGQKPLGTRSSTGRTIDLHEAARRVHYSSEYVRKMMFRDPNPPPFYKVRGRWRARLTEFDQWAVDQGLDLYPLPDEEAS